MTPRSRGKPPGNLAHLERLINEIAGADGEVKRIQRAVANTIVGQMLPPGVVKGGAAMQLRLGEAGSRFTTDLDAARAFGLSEDGYVEMLARRLLEGWMGFTGTVEADVRPNPIGVPDDYIMSPFRLRLAYKGRHWLRVRFELGRDEVGSTLVAEPRMAEDITVLFAALGLPAPNPVSLMPVAHQVAQKLHACTATGARDRENDRAQDLVDLQLLEHGGIDLVKTASVARRLFAARRAQDWPPTVVAFSQWGTIYVEAADGLEVISDVARAVAWANDLIERLDAASEQGARSIDRGRTSV